MTAYSEGLDQTVGQTGRSSEAPKSFRDHLDGMVLAVVENFFEYGGYGFARWRDESIYFSQRQEYWIADGRFNPYGLAQARRVPQPGDTILLEPVASVRGPWARCWSFMHLYEETEAGSRRTAIPVLLAKVEVFFPGKNHGFARLEDGRSVFLSRAQEGWIAGEHFTLYRYEEERHAPAGGDLVLVRIGGPRERGRERATEWALHARAAQAAVSPPAAGIVPMAVPPPAPTESVSKPLPLPAEAPKDEKLVPKRDEWVVISLKIKRDRLSYGNSKLYGRVGVPWTVLLVANIKSLRPGDVPKVRCKPADGMLEAVEITLRNDVIS